MRTRREDPFGNVPGSGASFISRLGKRGRAGILTRRCCLRELAGGVLAACLSAAVVQAQFHPPDFGAEEAETHRQWEERERIWRLEAAYEARRARAHARLGSTSSAIDSQALCPALINAKSKAFSAGKSPFGPFVPRSATRPARPGWRGVAPRSESTSGLFDEYISEPIVQSICVNCHVEGGLSGHTRLVLNTSETADHEALNLAVFETFVSSVEGGADLILNKIQGVGHGGGVQVPAGSADFANMERFLRLLGGETSLVDLSPDTLFDGVTMAPPAKTMRRAALLFAGRLPTQSELNSVSSGSESALRHAIRGLMTGPMFHEFLVRAANDRLLTDRHRHRVFDSDEPLFVAMTNKAWEMRKASVERGYDNEWEDPIYQQWQKALQYGIARAPLELIAHVIENDKPYTEILTADYIMANSVVAEAYGADTKFDFNRHATQFRPSEIASYFRDDDSKIVDEDDELGNSVINPGNLATEYPHAGILNTTVFLRRYPSTATNRNRARSRWTYYHFLGLDVEKSASRTTDPDALADTDNPTMKNPACTVCHVVLDPIAGAFQNYGDEGFYRDQWGGMDSLAGLYKHPEDGTTSPYQEGDTWYRDMREPGFGDAKAPDARNSLQWLARQAVRDERFAEAAVKFWWPTIMGAEVARPPEDENDMHFGAMLLASTAQSAEIGRIASAFRLGTLTGRPYNGKDLLTEIVLSPWFRAASVTGLDPDRAAALREAGVERLLTPEELVRKTEAVTGYVWGRRFRLPFGQEEPRSRLNDFEPWYGYGLLYGGIDSDGITKRTGEMTALMASVAQSHAAQVSCPIVLREFFLWPEDRRQLFDGISKFDTPGSQATHVYEVSADSWESRQSFSLQSSLAAGFNSVRLEFTNDFYGGREDDRNLNLDHLAVRGPGDALVASVDLSAYGRQHCGGAEWDEAAYYRMWGECSLTVQVNIPADGVYHIEVEAHQDPGGDEDARLAVSVESNDGTSRGAEAIRKKLVDLHQRLFGTSVLPDSPEVNAAFELFVEVWNRRRSSEGSSFWDARFECVTDDDHSYYDGILDNAMEFDRNNNSGMDWRRIEQYLEAHYDFDQLTDPNHAVRTWVVTLAYLLTDYRYLYF